MDAAAFEAPETIGHDLLQEHYERERATGHHLRTRLQSSVPDEQP